MTSTDVKFYIGDQIFTGWDSVSIQRNVDSLCGSFSMSFFDRWGNDASKWPLIPNRPIKVTLGTERVITGFVDDLSVQYDAASSSMSVAGRDKACDLVDCSAVPKEYTNLKADKIAEALLAPFGIELIVDADAGEKFAKWTVKPGETVFENLERLGKMRGLFFISDEFGRVHMQNRGNTKSNGRIVHDENILSASIKFDNLNRFSSYLVIGQSAGSDNFKSDETILGKGQATDGGVGRYRPLIIQAEGNADRNSIQKRANWELSVRIAKAVVVTVTVLGWTTANGNLWRVNELVDLVDPYLGINGDMLISSVTFKKSGEGTKTEMELVHKEAFMPEPEVVKQKAIVSEYEQDEE